MTLYYSGATTVASVAIATLTEIGVTACFVGGMACRLYGNSRLPQVRWRRPLAVVPAYRDCVKDLDILCLGSPWNQEELKRQVVIANPSFYTVPAKTPGATYAVLWYRQYSFSRRCKVDLLFPGDMDIPSVPIANIEYPEQGKPCAPFTLVFLLKLQAWAQHLDSTEERFRIKSATDALDLRTMLPIARTRGLSIRRVEAYLPHSFVASAVSRVRRFVGKWPETLDQWRALGFNV